MLMRVLFAVLAVLLAAAARAENTTAFLNAFAKTFALSSGSTGIQYNAQCLQRVRGLMQRHSISTVVSELRWNTTDDDLMRLAILAATAHISPWQRLAKDPALILLDDSGKLMPMYAISSMESNILLCVICTLLAVIASIHILSIRPSNGDT